MNQVKCHDCGMPYGKDDWIDTVLSDEQWAMIYPEHKGVLCTNCIIKRASRLKNIVITKMQLVFKDDYKMKSSIKDELAIVYDFADEMARQALNGATPYNTALEYDDWCNAGKTQQEEN